MKPLNYQKLMEKYKLINFDFDLSNLDRYTKNNLIVGHWDFDSIYETILKDKEFAIITGFSASGNLHFGNKQPLDIAIALQKYGGKLFVPLSDTEAILTRNLYNNNLEQMVNKFSKEVISLGADEKNSEIYLHSENKEVTTLIFTFMKNLSIDDFRKIYGSNVNLNYIFALSNMLADVFYPQTAGYEKSVVVLGIDEVKHAKLIKECAKKTDFLEPSFIFLRILNGLGKGKMSKSKSKNNIHLSDKPIVAKNKLIKGSNRSLGFPEECLSYQMSAWHLETDQDYLDNLKTACRSRTYKCDECILHTANALNLYVEKLNK